MRVRPLIIDETLLKEVARVIEYARKHIYIPGETITPGDEPAYCLETSFGYRCVFSYTRTPRGFYRDLSISVGQQHKKKPLYPAPTAVFALADNFGFTGWEWDLTSPPEDWVIGKDVECPAIRVVQRVEGKW